MTNQDTEYTYQEVDENANFTDQVLERICPECGIRKPRLYEHLFLSHSYTKDRIDQVKKQDRLRKVLAVANDAYFCELCGLVYKTRGSLLRHNKVKHDVQGTSISRLKVVVCPLCEVQSKNHWALIKHVNEEHAISEDQYVIETATFEDRAAFENWKTHLEDEAVVRFSVTSRCKIVNEVVTYMRCSRSKPHSAYESSERPRSKKIVDNCTAFMKVAVNGDRIRVKFCRTHCGHELQPALLNMDNASERYIVSLLKEGFKPHQILRKVREKCREGGKHVRFYYTTYADIRSIAIRNKIDPARKDENDIKSVEMRVREGRADDGMRVYEPAISESGEGFILVVITPLQKSWIVKYGPRAVCVDDTFNLTSYCLRLATVIVVDEWDRGLPAAYLLSNRMTEKEVALMFNEIKTLVPNFETEYFMSDDCNSFFNGFKAAFPQTRAQKLLCTFHIMQAIKRQCVSKLKHKEMNNTVLTTVRNLCKTLNPEDFALKYSSLITFLNEKQEKDMVEYFENTWSPRIEQWGGFARRNSCVFTSMLIERFHRRLKHEVSSKKTNMRIDALLEIIISLVPTLEEDRVINMARGLREGRYRLMQHHRAHALAVKLFGNNREAIRVVEEGLWSVTDRRGVHYVEQQFCMCHSKINNHCDKCNACAYAFLCECIQDARAGISCAHVHAALLYASEGVLAAQREVAPSQCDDGLPSTSGENDENIFAYVQQSDVQGGSSNTDRLETNKELVQKFESVYAALRRKVLLLSKFADDKVQDRMEVLIERMRDMDVEVSEEIAALRGPLSRTQTQLARRSELSSTGRPPNQTPIRLTKRSKLKPKKPQAQQPVREYDPDEILCCIVCFRRIPDDGIDRDQDEWLKCSTCGLWAHESCTGEGTPCPYDEGHFCCALLAGTILVNRASVQDDGSTGVMHTSRSSVV